MTKICFFFTSFQQASEVRRLNSAIGDLRGACDSMVKKVTTLTGGKGETLKAGWRHNNLTSLVPLGEDSIKDYKPYLSQDTVPESPHCDTGAGKTFFEAAQLDIGFCFVLS